MLNIPEEIKQLLKQGSIRKNLRIHFPNGEHEDITNSNLLSESFSFSESIMSQSEFKFGLCEASMVEFEMFNIGNIKGYEIEIFHEIDVSILSNEFIAEYGITSDDVTFPFYRIPYGRFVVDECLKQADMTKRRVVAYTNEVDLENIPNPIEKAKWDGTLNISQNLPYDFNVPSVVYSNALVGDVDYFTDKTAMELDSGTYEIASWSWQDVSSFWISVKADFLFFKVDTNEVADNLYWLKYNNANFIDEVIEETKRLVELDEYLQGDTKANLEKITKYLKYGWWYDERSKYIPLNNFRYIYPHLNYPESTSDSGGIVRPNKGYSWICIPYKATVGYYAQYGNIETTTTTISEKTFDIRDSSDVVIYRIENLPQLRMSVKRTKITSNGSTAYQLQPNKIDMRGLVEGYVEINGKLGKTNRNGFFEMVSINNNLGLVPSKLLVPSKSLTPGSFKGENLKKTNYSSLWYDDYKTLPYDRVSVSYKNSDGEEEYAEKWIVDNTSESYNANDYQEYSLSENYLIQKGIFNQEQIEQILESVGSSLVNLQYMPFEMKSIGLPYLESGDVVIVESKDGNFQTFILDRRIDGIQSLKDNINAN